ncbi:unnamed protein product [Anisakis simplex]|uniref:Amidohydrolase n=1 Tax=Anisakis simplex TaxID=6269 RepID=A0A0M3JMA0_ANISI|nr:unnamed protein product [Anisakis simplex]
MGVAMMMQQASLLAGANRAAPFDLIGLEGKIRKAKAEGRTVTVVNGSVYFDYQHVANVPPGMNLGT